MKGYRDVAGAGALPATFRFAADGQRSTFLLTDFYCEDALCPGPETQVVLTDIADPKHVISFEVDRVKSQVRWDKDAPFRDQAIANEFNQSRANGRLLERRRLIVRAWGLSQWDGPARPRDARCYYFEDFTFEREPFFMQFASGSEEWLALDQYCVNEACRCDEAILTFYRNEKTKGPAKPAFDLRYGLATGTCDGTEGAQLARGATDLLAALKSEVGDLQFELGLRRRLLRATAKRRLRDPAVVASSMANVGRNEPCPCGSGRKFKKCCAVLA